MCPQITSLSGCKATMVAFIWLSSTVCFQMSIRSASMRGNKIAANALVWPFTVCFSNVFSNRLPERRHICTICIFWLVSTVCFQMSVHNDCMRIKSGIGCIICSTFLQWLFSYVFSNSQPGRRRSHIGCTCLVFFLSYVFKCTLKWPAQENAKSHLLHFLFFSSLGFHL